MSVALFQVLFVVCWLRNDHQLVFDKGMWIESTGAVEGISAMETRESF
jgi:hypothetical protein